MAAPVSRLGGPSLLSTSPMCMQSTISDLINPEGKRMRTDELDALLNSQKKTRGEGDLLSLVSDGDNITSTPQRLEDTLPLDLKLTPSVDKVCCSTSVYVLIQSACVPSTVCLCCLRAALSRCCRPATRR